MLDEKLEEILGLIKFDEAPELHLAYVDLTDDQLKKLSLGLASGPRISLLDVSGNNITDDNIRVLIKALKNCIHLSYLDIGWNQITANALKDILKDLSCIENLTTLKVSNNIEIADQGAEIISEFLVNNNRIQRLKCHHCNISAENQNLILSALQYNKFILKTVTSAYSKALELLHQTDLANTTTDVYYSIKKIKTEPMLATFSHITSSELNMLLQQRSLVRFVMRNPLSDNDNLNSNIISESLQTNLEPTIYHETMFYQKLEEYAVKNYFRIKLVCKNIQANLVHNPCMISIIPYEIYFNIIRNNIYDLASDLRNSKTNTNEKNA